MSFFGAIGFILIVLGIGGIDGAIYFGTGYLTSGACLIMGAAGIYIDYRIDVRKEELEMCSEKLNGPGFIEMGTKIFVSEEDAYQYAMERISQDEDLKREFEEMLVEWFYSGNWIKED